LSQQQKEGGGSSLAFEGGIPSNPRVKRRIEKRRREVSTHSFSRVVGERTSFTLVWSPVIRGGGKEYQGGIQTAPGGEEKQKNEENKLQVSNSGGVGEQRPRPTLVALGMVQKQWQTSAEVSAQSAEEKGGVSGKRGNCQMSSGSSKRREWGGQIITHAKICERRANWTQEKFAGDSANPNLGKEKGVVYSQ